MTHSEPARPDGNTVFSDPPSFELEYFLDDDEAPTTMTVCSAENPGSIATEWITIDIRQAVPLEQVR